MHGETVKNKAVCIVQPPHISLISSRKPRQRTVDLSSVVVLVSS